MPDYTFDFDGRVGTIPLDRQASTPQEVELAVRNALQDAGESVPEGAVFKLLEGELRPPSGSFLQRGLGAVKRAVGGPPLETYESAGGVLGGLARKGAAALVPGSGMEAAALVGTGGAAGLASKLGLKSLGAGLLRLFGSAAGGELGAELEGEPFGTGAMVGAAGAGLGEIGTAGAGLVRRSLPGVKGKIVARETAQFAKEVGTIVKPLRGVRTAQDLYEAARSRDKGLFLLGNYMEETLQRAERRLASAARRTVPPTPPTMPAGPTSMYMRSGALEWDKLSVPALGDAKMTLREAGEALKEIGHRGFGGGKAEPTARTIVGKSSREAYEQALGQIEGELRRIDPTGVTWALFERGRQQYSAGVTLLELLEDRRAFIRLPAKAGEKTAVELNLPWIKGEFAQRLGTFKERLPARDYQALVNLFYRGAPIGAADIMPPGRGQLTDALDRFLRQRATGSAQLIQTPLATAFPLLGARWAGRAPFVPSARARTIADLLGIHGVSEGLGQVEEPRR